MVEIKILTETEIVTKKPEGHEQIEDNIFEVPPKEGAKLIERGVARTASWTDFKGDNL